MSRQDIKKVSNIIYNENKNTPVRRLRPKEKTTTKGGFIYLFQTAHGPFGHAEFHRRYEELDLYHVEVLQLHIFFFKFKSTSTS